MEKQWPPPEQLSFEEVDTLIDSQVRFYNSTMSFVCDGEVAEATRVSAYPIIDGLVSMDTRGSYGRMFFDLFGPDHLGGSVDEWIWTAEPVTEAQLDRYVEFGLVPS